MKGRKNSGPALNISLFKGRDRNKRESEWLEGRDHCKDPTGHKENETNSVQKKYAEYNRCILIAGTAIPKMVSFGIG